MATRKTASKAAPAKPAAKKSVAPVPAAAPAVKKGAAAPAVAAKKAPAAKPAAKPAKPKLVRDSFTMPKAEYAAIDVLKQRAAKLARPAKKSELLRAGVKALSALSDKALLAALGAVPTIKTGRPNKD